MAILSRPSEAPVAPGSRADREGLDGVQYVTGLMPDQTFDERFRDEEDAARQEAEAEAAMDEGPELAEKDEDELDDENLVLPEVPIDPRIEGEEVMEDDVDGQGRLGDPDRDWQGQAFADGGRSRPSDGSQRRRK